MGEFGRERFIRGYSGSELLKKHALNEFGFWHIFGEDPNCDMGGTHINPDLGIVEGELDKVIDYAMELDRFWNWGSGGNIVKVDVKRVGKTDCCDVI